MKNAETATEPIKSDVAKGVKLTKPAELIKYGLVDGHVDTSTAKSQNRTNTKKCIVIFKTENAFNKAIKILKKRKADFRANIWEHAIIMDGKYYPIFNCDKETLICFDYTEEDTHGVH